jgi:hypothetical protein
VEAIVNRQIPVVLIAATIVLLVGCAAGPNPLERTPGPDGVAGFWLGLWHGLIAPITFIISVFNRHVHFYDVHNNGVFYNLGFVIGAGLLLSGGILGRGKSS